MELHQQPIHYTLEPDLSVLAFIDLLHRSGLAERRPVDQPDRIEKMLRHADLIATARDPHGALLGVARAISDFAYCTYLSDLAVDRQWQRQGIGRRLIEQLHQAAGLETRLILLAAPSAQSYYPRIGMQQHPSCWMIPPQS
ncbi:MAG: GNAT family N-acetyltransferase [Pirellulaceae bacterium]